LQRTRFQVLEWKIESNIIHGFVDEFGVVNESKGYAPPHVPLVGDTQIGLDVVVVITYVKTQQAVLGNIGNNNQCNNLEMILNKGKRAIKPNKHITL
jgi:hypothetical protein